MEAHARDSSARQALMFTPPLHVTPGTEFMGGLEGHVPHNF